MRRSPRHTPRLISGHHETASLTIKGGPREFLERLLNRKGVTNVDVRHIDDEVRVVTARTSRQKLHAALKTFEHIEIIEAV